MTLHPYFYLSPQYTTDFYPLPYPLPYPLSPKLLSGSSRPPAGSPKFTPECHSRMSLQNVTSKCHSLTCSSLLDVKTTLEMSFPNSIPNSISRCHSKVSLPKFIPACHFKVSLQSGNTNSSKRGGDRPEAGGSRRMSLSLLLPLASLAPRPYPFLHYLCRRLPLFYFTQRDSLEDQ